MNKEFLQKICAVKGASGEEGRVAELILSEIGGLATDYNIDALGNLIVHKKGPGPKIMLAGHMDQVGMIIHHIDKEGFLWFSSLGWLDPITLHSCRVIFDNGTVGVINCERLEPPDKEILLENLYIDIGASSKEEAEKYVGIGDICVYCETPVIDDHKIVSPALDNRLGCYIMAEALKKVANLKFDLYLVFTVQEELGIRGARTSAYTVDPDYGLAYDVTISADTPKTRKLPQKLGGGACIKIKDASVICHPLMVRHMEKCAKECKVKYQFEILEAGETDSGAIHLNKGGVPSGVMSIATRHIHGMNELAKLSDIEACIDLTVKILETEIE